MNRYTEQDINWLRENYPTKGPKYCADHFNLSKENTAVCLAKRFGIKSLGTSKYGFEFNEDLTDPYLIYLLGYIWADGSFQKCKRSARFKFEININDGVVVGKYFEKIAPTNVFKQRICHYKKKSLPTLVVETRNREFCAMLEKFDFEQKSFCEPTKLLNELSEEMKHYFWRGFFDGDGCIHVSSTQLNRRFILFAGQRTYEWTCLKNLLDGLKIHYKHSITECKLGARSTITFWRFLDAEIFFKYLYPIGLDMGLDRKFDKFTLKEIPIGFKSRPTRRKSIE